MRMLHDLDALEVADLIRRNNTTEEELQGETPATPSKFFAPHICKNE